MVDVAGAPVVAVLTRAPGHGGKSRLFAELRRPPDPALLTALLLDTLDGVRVSGVRRVVAVEPGDACDGVRSIVPEDVAVVPQHAGSLGDRMRAVMSTLFAQRAAAVVVVGSDLPDIAPAVVADAFTRLAKNPGALAIGPARDGGYYLIGARETPQVFAGIEWGTPRVFSQTMAAALRQRLPVEILDTLDDVDCASDLRRVVAPRTSAWVRASFLAE